MKKIYLGKDRNALIDILRLHENSTRNGSIQFNGNMESKVLSVNFA